MRPSVLCSLGLVVLGLLLGCAVSSGTPTGTLCPGESAVSYNDFVADFMGTYCTECHSTSLKPSDRHGAPSDHNFDTRYDVLANAEHIDQRVGAGPDAINTSMPPSGWPTPSVEEREKLSEWLACRLAGQPEPL